MQGHNTETKIEDIKNFLSDHGQMAWVEYPKNATEVGLCCSCIVAMVTYARSQHRDKD